MRRISGSSSDSRKQLSRMNAQEESYMFRVHPHREVSILDLFWKKDRAYCCPYAICATDVDASALADTCLLIGTICISSSSPL